MDIYLLYANAISVLMVQIKPALFILLWDGWGTFLHLISVVATTSLVNIIMLTL